MSVPYVKYNVVSIVAL